MTVDADDAIGLRAAVSRQQELDLTQPGPSTAETPMGRQR
jgi:hypothetical protein